PEPSYAVATPGVDMKSFIPFVCALAMVAGLMAPLAAAEEPAPRAGQQPPDKQDPKQDPKQKPEEPPRIEETVVVSASRAEEKLVNAPSTMSVITAAQIEVAPSQNVGELLRTIPGVNITQVSARDINVTTRGATGTL